MNKERNEDRSTRLRKVRRDGVKRAGCWAVVRDRGQQATSWGGSGERDVRSGGDRKWVAYLESYVIHPYDKVVHKMALQMVGGGAGEWARYKKVLEKEGAFSCRQEEAEKEKEFGITVHIGMLFQPPMGWFCQHALTVHVRQLQRHRGVSLPISVRTESRDKDIYIYITHT